MKTIPLTKGKVAIVDDADYESVNKYKWFAINPARNERHSWYAARSIWDKNPSKRRMVYLHRFLMGETGGRIDHIDGDGLNCTRQNMRRCTQTENMGNAKMRSDNKSGYRGVSWSKVMKQWHAQIQQNRKNNSIGYYQTAEEAAKAYDIEAIRIFGKFARPNFK